MSPLIRCIYVSAASRVFEPAELLQLLEKARVNNKEADLTGMLLHTEGSFFQVLEGPQDAVGRLYERILADRRHSLVTKVVEEPIDARDFGEWTMGHSHMTRSELGSVVGSNDFFTSANCFHVLDEGRAKRILEGFREGAWRKTLA